MIEHVVLFKLKPGIPDDRARAMTDALIRLQDRVPGIVQATAGTNFSTRSQGYTHGFVARFKDREALGSYQVHPAHVAVVEEYVKPLSEGVLALDYEIP